MKVTMFSFEYPPNIYGGVGIHLKYLTQALSKKIKVDVHTLPSKNREKIKSDPSVKEFSHWNAFKKMNPEKHIPATQALATNVLMCANNPEGDILHTHTWYTNFCAFLGKTLYEKPVVSTVHSLEPLRPWKAEQIGSGYNLSTWMEKKGLEISDGVIAVSKEMKKDIHKVYKIPSKKITVIHNGIDLKKYKQVKTKNALKKLKIPNKYILFVGRLTRQKGIFDLVEAAKLMDSDMPVVLITGKPDTPEIEKELKTKIKGNKQIIWINDMLSEEDIIELYSNAYVFVCPSVYEPFGIINLEAMACKKPVIASKVGGIKEIIIDKKTGFFIPPNKPSQLSKRLQEIIENPHLAKEMGVNGRKRVEQHFSWDAIAKKTIDLYKTLL